MAYDLNHPWAFVLFFSNAIVQSVINLLDGEDDFVGHFQWPDAPDRMWDLVDIDGNIVGSGRIFYQDP